MLFNNAALFDMGSVLQAGLDQYDRLFSVNVRAMYAVMQAVANASSRQNGRDPSSTWPARPGIAARRLWRITAQPRRR